MLPLMATILEYLTWAALPILGFLGLVSMKFLGSPKKSEEGGTEGNPEGPATPQRRSSKSRTLSAKFEQLVDSATTQQPIRKTYSYKPNRRSSQPDFEASNTANSSNESKPRPFLKQASLSAEPYPRPPKPKRGPSVQGQPTGVHLDEKAAAVELVKGVDGQEVGSEKSLQISTDKVEQVEKLKNGNAIQDVKPLTKTDIKTVGDSSKFSAQSEASSAPPNVTTAPLKVKLLDGNTEAEDLPSPSVIANQEQTVRHNDTRKLASFPTKSDTKGEEDQSTQAPSSNTSLKSSLGKQKPTKEEEPFTSAIASIVSESERRSSAEMIPQVRVLSLNHNEHLNSTVFRLQKGYSLQFRPGPTLFGRKVNVFTNHPVDVSEAFQRSKYRRLDWRSDSTNKGDDTALYVEVGIRTAGSFHFYFTYDESEDLESAAGSGYFLVDPVLTVGQNDEVLPMDCIQCQTVMAKCMGTLDQWKERLRVGRESGYNVIHFTPVQELGKSRSGYSLANQLRLNPEFNTPDKEYGMEDLENLVQEMKNDWKVLSLTDIVLNHTANESPWLKEHPEATYNMITAPHLRPAYIIDRALFYFSVQVADGEWESRGIPRQVNHEHHLQAIRNVLFDVLSKPRVEEFFLIDAEVVSHLFHAKVECSEVTNAPTDREDQLSKLCIIQDPNYGRNSSTIDLDSALLLFNINWPGFNDEESRRKKSVGEFRNFVEHLNRKKTEEVSGHLRKAVDCVMGTISYERLQEHGPKHPEVSKKYPFTSPYFTHYGPDKNLEDDEKLSFSPYSRYLMAHNGWVMGHDPLVNFALEGSNVYLRRELVAWGDSVKLRYGDKPEDCPYLWDFMRKYVEETAKVFHGIRLDNCHSTPIHVAEYLLDCARRVRPDLYVIAELFTNSDLTDNIFVNRLGINSLIREAMSAPNSHEEGRLVYRYGGEPVGAFLLPPVRPLTPSIAHAIFLDLTHDNRSPCEVRTGWDMLPSTALVNMACCASGSNRGYDEIVPHHIHVVYEERKYSSWTDNESVTIGQVNNESGIIKAKRLINDLHFHLGKNGYNQVFVDQVTEHVVTVTRHNPVSHQSVILVAFTSFRPPSQIGSGFIRPLKVEGQLEEILFECSLKSKEKSDEGRSVPGHHVKDSTFINGVNEFELEVRSSLQAADATLVRQLSASGSDTTEFEYTEAFRPGSVIAFKFSLLPSAQESVNKIRKILSDFSYKNRISEVSNQNQELLDIVSKLSLSDLNRVLYRCDQEERDEGRGWGAYSIPDYGAFVYCGLQGLISELCHIRVKNDLGHPVCGNLRSGDWLPDYVCGRLKLESSTESLGKWLEEVFSYLKSTPRYLIPAYFDAIIAAVYFALINQSWALMGRFVEEGSDFVKALSLCCVQFCGVVKSALLPPLSPNLAPPEPPTYMNNDGDSIQASVTISAGLPHFSTGYMRNWGRDTFIALPGNLLITGRFQEARWIILAFASTLRHGLIPNLLDGGANARFNCRDAVWFWLYSIQQYVKIVPNGHEIFKDKVSRLFPKDDSPPQPPGEFEHLLEDVIQEALEKHFQGIKFRERNAGLKIDSQMTDQGFDNEIGIDKDTGFPYGGNPYNCGTWMDKMGSSEKAGNKGKPATPRDGSAVEIVGLCKATVRFLGEMNKEGKYPFNGVVTQDSAGNQITWNFKFWETKISDHFEKYFWVSDTPDPTNEQRQDLINRRGIYKDSIRASQPWADYQLRCNFPIAIAAAPEMFTPDRAWKALDNVEKLLLGPLGIKTLDPSDWNYRGNYDNANDSSDASIARGFNYHQGPEWVWPVGFFLRARLAIASKLGPETLRSAKSHIKSLLASHFTHISSSPWRSLPELTNSNGSFCRDSNPAQAWSTGCLLEVLYEMNQLQEDES